MDRRKKTSYKFTDKVHPAAAIASVIVAAILYVILAVIFYQSSQSSGKASIIYGGIAFICMLVSLGSFIVSLMALKKDEIFYRFPVIGCFMNGSIFISLLILYLIGLGT